MADNSVCPHFGVCGGCASQDRPYLDQLAEKEEMVRRGLRPFFPRAIQFIVASPDIFFYRNKMEFAFGGLKDQPPLLGLRQKGKFDRIVDLTECRLLSPETGRLLAAVRAWAVRENIPTYHLRSHRGFLRYLVVREGKITGQRMVCLVTAEGALPNESFVSALQDSGVRVDTAVWSVNAGLSDVAWGEERAVLFGSGHIEDKLGNLSFQISPRTFFQTNTRGAERLYQIIKDGLPDSCPTLFDVYCGSGSIGFFCADRVKKLVGIELNESAVSDARANALSFGIDHAQFHVLDASVFAKSPEFLEAWKSPGAVAVMDPPRPGLSAEVRKLLLDHPIESWVYVSCNPEALARDLAVLSPTYNVKSVQPVDLFPHTPHVETVVQLKAKDCKLKT
ncbi:MAG: 23S rRNA (uracil(1939)-C(5))-methyltransferase RlmD [Elusimicrobia bacterium]|nr:23S rRNA (uracil(1939)-C(5))-methyltransferase RlmD [Elusimicrobiota bacterium]